jgi:hypothetical protein
MRPDRTVSSKLALECGSLAAALQRPGFGTRQRPRKNMAQRSKAKNAAFPGWIPTNRTAAKLALRYAFLSALWILFSGLLLHSIVKEHELANFLENVKGGLFVAVTALLLYLALNRYFRETRKSAQLLHESEQRWQFALESVGHGVWDWNPLLPTW